MPWVVLSAAAPWTRSGVSSSAPSRSRTCDNGRVRRRLLVTVALLAGLTACTEQLGEHAGTGGATTWGPVTVRPGYYEAETLPITLVSDGDPVMLRFAPQGGFAMFVGARVSGLDAGPAEVASELVNPDDGVALVFDARSVELIPSTDASGDVEPDPQSSVNFSHLVPCPNYSSRAVQGVEWLLNLSMADPRAEARSGTSSVRVLPTCAPGPRYLQCVCECEPGYSFAKCGAYR